MMQPLILSLSLIKKALNDTQNVLLCYLYTIPWYHVKMWDENFREVSGLWGFLLIYSFFFFFYKLDNTMRGDLLWP